MPSSQDFDWDRYMNSSSYNAVLDGMRIARLIIPTMFSPDKKLIYLATLDISIPTDNKEQLNAKFADTYESIKREVRNMVWSCEKLYRLQVDYLILFNILSNLDALPEGYQHPEYYLELAMQEKKLDK